MIRVGTSGWTYRPWHGDFYPRGTRDDLAHLSRRLATVEVNATFYGPRKESDYLRWHSTTPDDFVFALKAPREVTHNRRLRDASALVAEFLSSGISLLGNKLGPILWQLPASLRYDPVLLAEFLPLLPAANRHALEVRHSSYYNDQFIDQLTEHRVALVTSDSPGIWPCLSASTSDFSYYRLHGDTELYTSRYTDEALDAWAAQIRTPPGDAYVYLDNTMAGAAPWDAMRLAGRLRDPYLPGDAQAPDAQAPDAQ
ncbi:DUF72 domain-containing protein [Actinokineospora diospyrosa]|uniref:Uncharacterized conserved protein YecE, DUF72 family n=1 Tax=Actinokineospora diospyrosa TaxID=103728 RepID=A0ABT1I4W2_9PSEU|nr:DUF72 domain-containing protein [Actinokineospora diospyrosa]MCP2267658.1 Uncharacterized conserved protein YecE, DUF72 family [Actinokineospora diospyrosa]